MYCRLAGPCIASGGQECRSVDKYRISDPNLVAAHVSRSELPSRGIFDRLEDITEIKPYPMDTPKARGRSQRHVLLRKNTLSASGEVHQGARRE